MLKIAKHRYLQIAIGLILVILLCSLPTLWTGGDQVLVAKQDQWLVREAFSQNGEFPSPSTAQDRSTIQKNQEDIDFWASWSGDDKLRGRILSPSFKAPAILGLYIAGYPNQGKNEIFLRRLDSKAELKLPSTDAGEHWRRSYWVLPSDWQGVKVRLIASDRSAGHEGWLGISSPLRLSWATVITDQLPFLAIVPVTAIHLLLLVLPGFLLMLWWQQHFTVNLLFAAILSIFFSAILGYIAFWLYWFNPHLGRIFSIAICSSSAISIFLLYRWQRTKLLTALFHPDLVFPVSGMLLVSLFYLAIFFTVDSNQPPESWMMFRFQGMPPDNILPKLFADKLYAGEDLRQPLLEEWLSSDRPPLQTGILLLQYPLVTASSWSYQILSVLIQCTWVPALWSLCRTIHLSSRQIALAFTFTIFSGFFFFNSLFTWPKFLAAACFIFAFSLLLQSILENEKLTPVTTGLIAAAIALGLLSHGGVVFTLPAIAILPLLIHLIHRKPLHKPIRRVLVGCLIFFCLVTPWGAYQKLYNPPGDRLTKWHLAGVTEIDDRTATEAIIDSYTRTSLEKLLSYKRDNLLFLWAPQISNDTELMRANNFFRVFNSLGWLNLGWLVGIYICYYKPLRTTRWFRGTAICLGVGLASIVVWIFLSFGPATTSIHSGSYATIALLFLGLSNLISILPNFVIIAFAALQTLLFAYIWIFTTPPEEALDAGQESFPSLNSFLNFPAIFLSVVFAIMLVIFLLQLAKQQDIDRSKEV